MSQITRITLEQTDAIIQTLWSPHKRVGEPMVYIILDGARNRKIFPMLNDSGAHFWCLLNGKLSYELAQSAPYMLRLNKNADFTREIIQQAWGNSWGIFAITYKPITLFKVRYHCKNNLSVQDEQTGCKLFFRFYDPRVMRVYLPTCNELDAEKIFGPVSEFMMEGKKPDQIMRFISTKQGVVNINNPKLTETQVNKVIAAQKKPRSLLQDNILKIREEQMSALKHQALEKDYQRIKQQFIADFMDDNAFHLKVNDKNVNIETFSRVCFNEALNFKLSDHYSIYRYFQLSYQQGWKFWEQPENLWAKEILESTSQGKIKIEKIERSFSVSLMEQF